MNPINFVTRPEMANYSSADIVLLSFLKSIMYDYNRTTDPMDRALIVTILSSLPRVHKFETQEASNDATQSFFNANGAATMQDMMNGAYNPEILKERLDKIVQSFDKLSKGY
jgi:hypothetical protein|nr:MAG TPA: hypothetical protein [Caudoviricetes sp.]